MTAKPIPGLTRRGALELLAAGACTALIAAGARARPAGRLTPPPGPMLFRHRVLREMVGGARIVTERGFEVRFIPLEQGYRVEGAQVSSTIEAPPDLAQLAEIERKRVDTHMFPVNLDSDGFVLAGPEPDAHPIPEIDEAVDVALAMLRKGGSSEADITAAQGFLFWLQRVASAVGEDMPRRLFVPPAEPEQATRAIELPGGGGGSIETRFWGSVSPETGLMQTAEREIVTRTEETSRRSGEYWSLTLI